MSIASGRKALVTGGASGFGLAIAQRLREAGASVASLDVSQERLEDAEARLGVLPLQADVRSPAAMRAAVDQCAAAFGGLDTLVISAGVIHIKPLEDVNEDDWELAGTIMVSSDATRARAIKAVRADARIKDEVYIRRNTEKELAADVAKDERRTREDCRRRILDEVDQHPGDYSPGELRKTLPKSMRGVFNEVLSGMLDKDVFELEEPSPTGTKRRLYSEPQTKAAA